jgi:hypothetical protein
MRPEPLAFRSEAERDGDIERLQRFHLALEPRAGIGSFCISPAQAGTQFPYS